MNEEEKSYEVSESVKSNIGNFQLFTSHTDKVALNIFEISDPYEFLLPKYMDNRKFTRLSQLFNLDGTSLINLMATGTNLKNLIFNSKKGFVYQPDFDSLSIETKEGLKSGILKISQSKKVDGNMRAVIVDTRNSNQRVEDLTLKEFRAESDITRNLTDLAVQAQLKQIYEILLDIQETQEYQLQWDRNNSILAQFFTARTQIIKFHNTDDLNSKIQLLHDASQSMEQAVSAIKADLISNRDQIEKILRKPIHGKSFQRHANFVLSDINLLLKIVGMQTYIDLTLDNESMARERFESVKYIFDLYSSQTIPEPVHGVLSALQRVPILDNLLSNSESNQLSSMLEIIHDNYRYSSTNKNLWLIINDEMQEGSQLNLLSEGDSDHEE
ncbi:hypothetical protein P7D92_10645 [Enterococcus dongliensis]|uniref:hypothetical protein n=1 Tax=Enterococcus dongliensis TaxID=2559925 RepID=UPI00288F935B|nr:hypothetical protein [Enterococcus dongliensis]MDT2677411.1 hypothetical protein [Enterococcus dongliensis]